MSRMNNVAVLTTKENSIGEFKLSQPIVDGGKQLDVLYFRKPNVGDLAVIEEAAQKGQTDGNTILIARLAGILPEAAERMDLDDYEGIKEALPGFLSPTSWTAIQEALQSGMAVFAISHGMGSLATGENG